MPMRFFPCTHLDSPRVRTTPDQTRRHFLKTSACICAMFALPHNQAYAFNENERKLAFLNLHTGERIHTTYWAEGEYLTEGLSAIENVLRDHRTEDKHEIDRNLLDMLQLLNYKMATQSEFHVISGYRSPATNAQLNAQSSGVAKKSFHMYGMAIDVRLPGRSLSQLRDAALSLQAGGVGYYPRSEFIHMDTGHIRQWNG